MTDYIIYVLSTEMQPTGEVIYLSFYTEAREKE